MPPAALTDVRQLRSMTDGAHPTLRDHGPSTCVGSWGAKPGSLWSEKCVCVCVCVCVRARARVRGCSCVRFMLGWLGCSVWVCCAVAGWCPCWVVVLLALLFCSVASLAVVLLAVVLSWELALEAHAFGIWCLSYLIAARVSNRRQGT